MSGEGGAVTLQDHHRTRIVAAMKRRSLTCKDVARMAGCHERTVQRFVEGETFGLETLAKVEAALRLVSDVGTPTDSDVGKRRNVTEPPRQGAVVGWRQAAIALGMHRDTLYEHRRRHRDATVIPWWRSEAAVVAWFEKLISREVASEGTHHQ